MLKHIGRCGQKWRKVLSRMTEQILHIEGIDVHVLIEGNASLPTIVMLHGFSGSVDTWSEVTQSLKGKFHIVRIDLIGHGKTSAPEDVKRYRMAQQIAHLEKIFEQLNLEAFTLVGYSMGGRIALSYAIEYPERVSSLILESASPGLATEEERVQRQLSDKKLAERIVRDGLESFVNFWEEIPLFDSQKDLPLARRQKVRNERLNQQEIGLANSLLGIGTGSQPSYWREIEKMALPVLLITGEYDEKFIKISREMKRFFPNVQELIVNHVGHAIHVEKPVLFATMIEKHILEVN